LTNRGKERGQGSEKSSHWEKKVKARPKLGKWKTHTMFTDEKRNFKGRTGEKKVE